MVESVMAMSSGSKAAPGETRLRQQRQWEQKKDEEHRYRIRGGLGCSSRVGVVNEWPGGSKGPDRVATPIASPAKLYG